MIFYFRVGISVIISLPLGVSMIGMGVYSLQSCEKASTENITNTSAMISDDTEGLSPETIEMEKHHIPLWLIVAGFLVTLVPVIYLIYDVFCKPEDVKQSKCKVCHKNKPYH